MLKLEVQSLVVPLGEKVSQEISVSVERGEVLRIQGASGVGKTSLLECLCDLRKVVSGSVTWMPGPATRIGYAPQDEIFFGAMTIRYQLELFAKFQGMSASLRPLEVERLAALFGFSGLLERLPKELSGGQRKRVLLARALLGRPECIILDEVFAGLDTEAVMKLATTFMEEIHHWHPILIIVEHGKSLLEEYVTRELIL